MRRNFIERKVVDDDGPRARCGRSPRCAAGLPTGFPGPLFGMAKSAFGALFSLIGKNQADFARFRANPAFGAPAMLYTVQGCGPSVFLWRQCVASILPVWGARSRRSVFSMFFCF